MTPNEYQKEALRTEQPVFLSRITIGDKASSKLSWLNEHIEEYKKVDRLVNGLMGLNGEAGEAIDILKKHLFQGHKMDREHLAKELGDIGWYLAVSADALGYSLEEILQMNVDKLRARYPDGFETERSMNRDVDDV